MFRLKGDVCRQLSKKFKVSFKPQYRKEIKARILIFINHYENNLNSLSFTERLDFLKNKIIIENNEIIGISEDLINEELFNTFNILWYEQKEKKCYTKKEENEIVNIFVSNICYETYKEVLEKEINYELLLNFNAYNMEINNPLYQIEKSKEMYNKKSNIECNDINFCIKKLKNNQIIKKIKDKIEKFKTEIVMFKNNEFKNYKILMDKDVCFYGVLETKELDIFKNFNGEIEKARILNRKTARRRITDVDMERLQIGYQDITDYILFYIETKCLIKIEKIIKENS